ncbi:MAG: precorrin-8X methylmutase [Cellvibrionales bacterium]|nr:precorrin-8X methylmutase [Cellvibrionales bacterium]
MPYVYEKDPKAIEVASFETIRKLANLERFSVEEQQVVMRVVHSLGRPELSEQCFFTSGAVEKGRKALAQHTPILCDVKMVQEGITKRMISERPLCFLTDPETERLAKVNSETRSMAQLALWEPHLKDAVVVIGNAPTALFRLLEMLEAGCDKPALIIGMPVGFIGAAESKEALWENCQQLGVECITLKGREGGSAVASASCNALLRLNHGESY